MVPSWGQIQTESYLGGFVVFGLFLAVLSPSSTHLSPAVRTFVSPSPCWGPNQHPSWGQIQKDLYPREVAVTLISCSLGFSFFAVLVVRTGWVLTYTGCRSLRLASLLWVGVGPPGLRRTGCVPSATPSLPPPPNPDSSLSKIRGLSGRACSCGARERFIVYVALMLCLAAPLQHPSDSKSPVADLTRMQVLFFAALVAMTSWVLASMVFAVQGMAFGALFVSFCCYGSSVCR